MYREPSNKVLYLLKYVENGLAPHLNMIIKLGTYENNANIAYSNETVVAFYNIRKY